MIKKISVLALHLVSSVLLLTSVFSANATIITYTDSTIFSTDTLTTSIITPGSGGNGTTAGPLTFTNGPSASIAFSDYTSLLSGELALSNIENFNVDIAGGAHSFGFDVSDPQKTSLPDGCNVPTCVDSTFSFSVFDGATLIHSFNFDPLFSDTVLSFVGIYSDIKFDRVEIREFTNNFDNEYFGNFKVGVDTLTHVSEPSTLLLIVLSLFGVTSLRRKYLQK